MPQTHDSKKPHKWYLVSQGIPRNIELSDAMLGEMAEEFSEEAKKIKASLLPTQCAHEQAEIAERLAVVTKAASDIYKHLGH